MPRECIVVGLVFGDGGDEVGDGKGTADRYGSLPDRTVCKASGSSALTAFSIASWKSGALVAREG